MENFGVMYHHFHDDMHIKGQGSISAKKFEEHINILNSKYNIIDANEWIDKAKKDNLRKGEICLSFDDGLKCQYDIALPILKKYNIKALWSIYTSNFTGEINTLEIFRHFRFFCYKNIEDFYNDFFNILKKNSKKYNINYKKDELSFKKSEYLLRFKFYTENDRKFRFFRDKVLSKDQYDEVIFYMMDDKNYDPKDHLDNLWMKESHIKDLVSNGHILGLHTHSHAYNIDSLSYQNQFKEYEINQRILNKISKEHIDVVTYPFGRFNSKTDIIMEELGVKIGFNSNLFDNNDSKLHYGRLDHSEVIEFLRRGN